MFSGDCTTDYLTVSYTGYSGDFTTRKYCADPAVSDPSPTGDTGASKVYVSWRKTEPTNKFKLTWTPTVYNDL